MKAIFKSTNGRLAFELTGEDAKQIFTQLALVQEVFDAESQCGVCKCKDLRYQVRKVKDFTFYELACTNRDCRARFSFGQAKAGAALFPKRKDEDGKWLPNGGWDKYVSPSDEATHGPAPTSLAPKDAPSFADWDAAEKASNAGVAYLRVAGVLYQLKEDGTAYIAAGRKDGKS